MSKLLNVCLLLIMLASVMVLDVSFAYAQDELDGRYVEAIRKDLESETKEYYVVQAKMFGEDGSFSWEPEYLYVLTVGHDNNCTRVFIYKADSDNVTRIWDSIEFPGTPIALKSIDFDGDWVDEHLLFTQKKDPNGVKWYQVWIFSWEGAKSKLLYPKNIQDNKLTSMEMFDNIDYDRDWNYEFIVLEKKDEEHMYYKYYAFQDNNLEKLIIEKVCVDDIIKALPQTKPKELSVEEQYPEIVKFIREKYGDIEIYGINVIWHTFRHMVLTDIGKIIVEQRLPVVTEWCVLDASFNQYAFDPNMTMALDIDNDSMPEIPLYSFDEVNNRKIYHYLVSVSPGKYKLLSPLDENGRSKIWTINYSLQYDRTQDGSVVVIGFKETKDGYTDSYWKWEPKAQRLIEVLDY